jgi:class 3 adenylate cyclase
MGFGLHVGWAIEGAIGSFYKIDASYLSPNVNMASRLEAATKQFGVQLLISGQLFIVLTETAQQHMRMIDRVTVKGSVEPLGNSLVLTK